MFRWGYDFFGLSPTDKKLIHEEIFNLCHYRDGVTHSEVYTMPTYLRRFYLRHLVKVRKEENEQVKKSQSKNTDPRIRRK